LESASWGFIGTLFGALVGASTSIATTIISSRNASRMHSQKNDEERTERSRTFQRETLLATQDALQDLMRLMSRVYLADRTAFRQNQKWGENLLDDNLDESFRFANQKLSGLIQRISDEPLREALKGLRELISRLSLSQSADEAEGVLHAAGENFETVITHLGSILRSHY
jgi:hypothetical protein